MFGYVKKGNTKLFLFYKTKEVYLSTESFISSPSSENSEAVAKELNLYISDIEGFGAFVIKGDGGVDFTSIYGHFQKLFATHQVGIKTALENAIAKTPFYTYKEIEESCKVLDGMFQRVQKYTLTNKELLNNTLTYEPDAITKFGKPLSNTAISSDKSAVMEGPYSTVGLEVPNIYQIWQTFGVEEKDRDTNGMYEATPSNDEDEDEDELAGTPIYVVGYANVEQGILDNIGVFNKKLGYTTMLTLLNTDWINSEDKVNKDIIIGTRENSLRPVDDQEIEYFNKLKGLVCDGLVLEHYDGSRGPINLRKSFNIVGDNLDLESGITLDEARQYVDLEALIKNRAKCDLVDDYFWWVTNLALCATRPHLGFVKCPTYFETQVMSELTNATAQPSRTKEISSDGQSNVFNRNEVCCSRPLAMQYKDILRNYVTSLSGTFSLAECLVKLVRWGQKKIAYLCCDSQANGLNLETFEVVLMEENIANQKLVTDSDGSNRAIVGLVTANKSLVDKRFDTEMFDGKFKNVLLGFIVRKRYDEIDYTVDSFVDLHAVVQEYQEGNPMYKMRHITLDKDKFVIDTESLMEDITACEGTLSVTEAVDYYDHGSNLLGMTSSYSITDIIALEGIKNTDLKYCNVFESALKLMHTDSIAKYIEMYSENKKKLYNRLGTTSNLKQGRDFVNYSLAFRFLDLFKVSILEDNNIEKIMNAVSKITVPVGDMVPKAEVKMTEFTGFTGIADVSLDKIGTNSKPKDILFLAIKVSDSTGKHIAYAVRGIKPAEKFTMKFFDIETSDVRTFGDERLYPTKAVLSNPHQVLVKAAQGNIQKFYKLFNANFIFNSDTVRTVMQADYDFTAFDL